MLRDIPTESTLGQQRRAVRLQKLLACKVPNRLPQRLQYRCRQAAGPDISRLPPLLQQEWDHDANVHLGSITITPGSARRVWWSSGMCKSGQPHKWEARVYNRIGDRTSSPCISGRIVCLCNDLAHNYPEVAKEWDWEANGSRTPKTVAGSSNSPAAWKCSRCGNRWNSTISNRTQHRRGCPECAHQARRLPRLRHPSISVGAPHLLAEWDWESNLWEGWSPDEITLMSTKKVHWRRLTECPLGGREHKWQAAPNSRCGQNAGSPFPSGKAVCACNSLAEQCPDAAKYWDHAANGALTPGNVTVQSVRVVFWVEPKGRRWRQAVREVVKIARKQAHNNTAPP